MAGYTDAAMRRLCRMLGADMSVTEMVSAKAVCYGDVKTGELSSISAGEGDVALQLFGHEPDVIAEAARRAACGEIPGAVFDRLPAAIDLNMGCPVKKIVSSGDGCALMRDPKAAARIVKLTSEALSPYGIPLTVKIRAGWDRESINAPYFAALMADAGADAVTVHARTREQMYAPCADWNVIKDVKRELGDFPVIGNGDIMSADDARRMTELTGCDAVMIGRAALGDPWIFCKIAALREGKEYTPPDVNERMAAALRLVREVIAERGEYVGVREARGRIAHFIKGIPGAASVRGKLNNAETYSQLETIINEWLSGTGALRGEI